MNSNSTSTSYPRISIIVPSFNAEATIGRAVDSLIQQQYPDLEIICIDGASRDATVEVLRGYGPAISYLLSEPDRNSAEAINKGLRRATGELVGWLGADDELAPGALLAFAALFAANPHADVITGGCLRFYADGSQAVTAPVAGLEKYISMKNGIEQPSTLWTRALQSRVGELDTSFRMAFDHDLWCRFAQAGAKFVVTDKVLSHYHFSESTSRRSGGESWSARCSASRRSTGRTTACSLTCITFSMSSSTCADISTRRRASLRGKGACSTGSCVA